MALNWKVVLTKDAEENLLELDKKVRTHILKKLAWLENNFDQITPLPLRNEWFGFFKIRTGDYRVIYKVDWQEKFLVVARAGHRSEVYEKVSTTAH